MTAAVAALGVRVATACGEAAVALNFALMNFVQFSLNEGFHEPASM
jgi:hypothetical protein